MKSKDAKLLIKDKQIERLQERIRYLEEKLRIKEPEQQESIFKGCLKHSPEHNSECPRCKEIEEKRQRTSSGDIS